uniref:uncharacterized protein n=1 Tax=Semicossyphus pulcher TaxID=241346 RepID=UPI0037E88DF7
MILCIKMWLWILTGLNIITIAHSFAGGFVQQSCGTLIPDHGSSVPCDAEPRFQISYQPGNDGEPFTVSLQSKDSSVFRGFMLEAREEGGPSVGTFVALNENPTRLLDCNGIKASAASQRNNQRKTLLKVNWTAPETTLNKNITFRATFIQSFDACWEKVREQLITSLPTTTAEPTTTQPSMTSTAEPTTTQPSLTSTEEPTTTQPSLTSTAEPTTTQPSLTSTAEPRTRDIMIYLQKAIVLVVIDSVLVVVKTELSNIIITTVTISPLARRLSRGTKISLSVLCGAVEISAMVLLIVYDSLPVIPIALLCVMITMNTIELVLSSLPLGPSHELKQICDLAVKVCSVIHATFIIAFIYVAYLDIEDRRNRKESLLLWVTIGYTVWILLFVIWVFVFTTHKHAILPRRKIVKNSEQYRTQSKENGLCAAKAIVTAVSVILIVGTVAFSVALIVGTLQHTGE